MKVYYYMAFLLVVFSGFFLNIIPISPIYISFVIALLFYIGISFRKLNVRTDAISNCTCLFIIYLVITQIFILNNNNHAMYNVLFSLVYCMMCMNCLSKISSEQIKGISKIFINFTIIILLIETAYRWLHPQNMAVNTSSGISYYKYKYSSIMFIDSNFVGIFAVSIFFFGTYLMIYQGMNLKKQQIILAIVVLLTLSKASIIALVVFGYMYQLRIDKSKKKLILIGIIAAFGYELYHMLMNIGTMSRKLYAVENTWKYLKGAKFFNLLFGVGFGNTGKYIINGGHNIILVYIVESGIIGVVLLFLLFFIFLKKTDYRFRIVLFPFLLTAMSMVGHANQYLYVIGAIIYYLEKNNKQIN